MVWDAPADGPAGKNLSECSRRERRITKEHTKRVRECAPAGRSLFFRGACGELSKLSRRTYKEFLRALSSCAAGTKILGMLCPPAGQAPDLPSPFRANDWNPTL